MSRRDKGDESKSYQTYNGVQQAMDGVLKKHNVHCGQTTNHAVPYECHRAPKHQGCHLDVDRDCWFDRYKGKWVIMPRQDDGSKGARSYKRKIEIRRGQ